jgi:tetratricopeptide (TPR) repeat protein
MLCSISPLSTHHREAMILLLSFSRAHRRLDTLMHASLAASARSGGQAALVLTLGLLTLTIHSRVCTCDFVLLDDPVMVSHNPSVRAGLSASSAGWSFRRHKDGRWLPCTWLSYMCDATLYGDKAWGYHLTNLLLHVGNVLLVYRLLAMLSGDRARSMLIAALVAVHPLLGQSVVWISQRSELLAAFLGLLAAVAYIQSRSSKAKVRWAICSLLSFGFCLLARPNLIALPCLFLLLGKVRAHREAGAACFACIDAKDTSDITGATVMGCHGSVRPLSLVASGRLSSLISGVGAWFVGVSFCGMIIVLSGICTDATRRSAFVSSIITDGAVRAVTTLSRIVLPVDLNVFDRYSAATRSGANGVAAVLVLVSLSSVCVCARRLQPFVALGLAWYLIAVVPSVLLPDGGGPELKQETAYFATIGLVVCLTWALFGLRRSRKVWWSGWIGALIVVFWMGQTTYKQSAFWTDTVALCEHGIDCRPSDANAYALMGAELVSDGRASDAFDYLGRAVELDGNCASAHFDLGIVLREMGHREAARRHFEKSLADPDLRLSAELGIAEISCEEQDYADAKVHLRRVLVADPINIGTYSLLAWVLEQEGDWPRAIEMRERASQIDPNDGQMLLKAALDFRAKGDLVAARDRLSTLVNNGNCGGQARLQLARTLSMLGEVTASQVAYERLIDTSDIASTAKAEIAALKGSGVHPLCRGVRKSPNCSDELLIDGWPSVHMSVTTRSRLAQLYFDQGLLMLFDFNHELARRSFKAAAANDPECAMAYWGIAMANGPALNFMAVSSAREKEGAQAAARAIGLSKSTTPVEQALIGAISRRFSRGSNPDRPTMNNDYALAMRTVYTKFANNPDVGAFTAESLLIAHPWDQWTKDGMPRTGTLEICRILSNVLSHSPHHVFALHLCIHAWEGSATPERVEVAADALHRLWPSSPHLVHMPSHIYLRLGRWRDAVESNKRAVEVERAEQQVMSHESRPAMSIVHSYHILIFAACMEGNRSTAEAAVRELAAAIPKRGVPSYLQTEVEVMRAIPYEVLLRFGRWDEMLREPPPCKASLITTALWRYARGVAFAATGRLAEAEEEQRQFLDCCNGCPVGLRVRGVSVSDVLEIARSMLSGEILYREGRVKEAIVDLDRACRVDEGLRYMEPEIWLIPPRHVLGAILMGAGDSSGAERVYRKDLLLHPRNAWSLIGLARSLSVQARSADSAKVFGDFLRACPDAQAGIVSSSCLCVKPPVGETSHGG